MNSYFYSEYSKMVDDKRADSRNSHYSDGHEDDDTETSFTLASTMYDFSYEHGRRYSAYRDGSNPFPLDDLSLRNERILHHTMLFMLDSKHYISPLTSPSTVLDVRCGQGLWAEDIADLYPDSEVVAMDTVPRPTSTFPNLSYLVQSSNDEWILDQPGMKFDLIFARTLFASTNDFPRLYEQVMHNLAPNGYFEQIEWHIDARCDDNTARPDSMIRKLCSMTQDMSLSYGVEYNIAPKMARLVTEAGFTDVVERRFKAPIGPWSTDPKLRQLGEWVEAYYKSGLQGWCLAVMTRKLGYTPEQVNEMCEQAFQEVDARDQHFYFEVVIVSARKPA